MQMTLKSVSKQQETETKDVLTHEISNFTSMWAIEAFLLFLNNLSFFDLNILNSQLY